MHQISIFNMIENVFSHNVSKCKDFIHIHIIIVRNDLDMVALFLNDTLIGEKTLAHTEEDNMIADWQLPFEAGTLKAIAYDENGVEIARDEASSFGDAASLRLTANRSKFPTLQIHHMQWI